MTGNDVIAEDHPHEFDLPSHYYCRVSEIKKFECFETEQIHKIMLAIN
jgi:hypothetical protein